MRCTKIRNSIEGPPSIHQHVMVSQTVVNKMQKILDSLLYRYKSNTENNGMPGRRKRGIYPGKGISTPLVRGGHYAYTFHSSQIMGPITGSQPGIIYDYDSQKGCACARANLPPPLFVMVTQKSIVFSGPSSS